MPNPTTPVTTIALDRDDLILLSTLCLARVATMALNNSSDEAYKQRLADLAAKLDAMTGSAA
jgi:hypothetical protein